MDGHHYLAAAVSQEVFEVGFLATQSLEANAEQRPGLDTCVSNVSLHCRFWDNGTMVNVAYYDWARLQLYHNTSGCVRENVTEVCYTEERTEGGKMSTGWRPHVTDSLPYDVDVCVSGTNAHCQTNLTNCTHRNETRCPDEDAYVVVAPHYKWITQVHVSKSAYVYRWNDYGTTVLEDGSVGRGSGLQVFQILGAPRVFDAAFLVLHQQKEGAAGVELQEQKLLLLAVFGGVEEGDSEVRVLGFKPAVYNPYMRSNVGIFELKQTLACDDPPTALAVHMMTQPRLGLMGMLLAVAMSASPLAATARDSKPLDSTTTVAFYMWSEATGLFEQKLTRFQNVDLSKAPMGAMGLKFFQAEGEVYLAIAQGVCFHGQHNDSFDEQGCLETVATGDERGQPPSRVLQFNRVEADFGELLALTDASNMEARGEIVPDAEMLEHRHPLRFDAGRTREWEVIFLYYVALESVCLIWWSQMFYWWSQIFY
jgi:hypothetical protein